MPDFETTAARPGFSVVPILTFWQQRAAKIGGAVVLGILLWNIYTLFSDTAFYVYRADVSGNVALSYHEIYTAAEIDSQSIFWINPLIAAEKIEALPNIKSATVFIDLPARVTIKVIERRPQLLWQVNDTIWWVDQEGTIVPPRSDIDENMLRIIDDDRQPLDAGYQIDPTIIQGAQALRLLAPDVKVIRHTRAQGLIVATPEGWPVYLGDGSEMRAKLVVLSTLLAEIRTDNTVPNYIDLRNPLRPVYQAIPVIRIGQPVVRQQFPQQPARR